MRRLPIHYINALMLLLGAYMLTDTWRDFAGVVLLGEALLVSIERCWPEGERP